MNAVMQYELQAGLVLHQDCILEKHWANQTQNSHLKQCT